MSNQAVPISLEQFSTAIQSLPLSTLRRTGAELRNSIAHLDYSNEQLKPFVEGKEESLNGQPDEDCRDAIRENEIVIIRMTERLARLKQEVEARGSSWLDSSNSEKPKHEIEKKLNTDTSLHNNETYESQSSAWKDGTITTGILNSDEIFNLGNRHVTHSAPIEEKEIKINDLPESPPEDSGERVQTSKGVYL